MSVEHGPMTAQNLREMRGVPGNRCERVVGEARGVHDSVMLRNLLAAAIYSSIRDFLRENDLGLAFTDGLGFLLQSNPDRVCIPNASFLAHGRISAAGLCEGCVPTAPSLAVEVISSHEKAYDLQTRVNDYLGAGTQTAWVVWPKLRSVTVHLPDGSSRSFDIESELDGGDVLPGLRIPVATIFESVS